MAYVFVRIKNQSDESDGADTSLDISTSTDDEPCSFIHNAWFLRLGRTISHGGSHLLDVVPGSRRRSDRSQPRYFSVVLLGYADDKM